MNNRREPARLVLVAFLLGATSAFLISYLHPTFARIADPDVWPILQSGSGERLKRHAIMFA